MQVQFGEEHAANVPGLVMQLLQAGWPLKAYGQKPPPVWGQGYGNYGGPGQGGGYGGGGFNGGGYRRGGRY